MQAKDSRRAMPDQASNLCGHRWVQPDSVQDLRLMARLILQRKHDASASRDQISASGVTNRQLVLPHTRADANVKLRAVLDHAAQSGEVRVAPLLPVAADLVQQVYANQDVMLGLTGLRVHDAYTYEHSVNVCILAVMIGVSLGYDNSGLTKLGLGALLHDVGKAFIPPSLLTKAGALTPEEYEEIKKHTLLGHASVLRSSHVEEPVGSTVLQHHERLDGSGYPHGVNRHMLSLDARIVSVADFYDAISSNRPYREAMDPLKCMSVLRCEAAEGRLMPEAVEVLMARIAPYPQGATVRLSDGRLAVVTRCFVDHPKQPEVVAFGADSGRVLRLADHPDLGVAELVVGKRLAPAGQLDDHTYSS